MKYSTTTMHFFANHHDTHALVNLQAILKNATTLSQHAGVPLIAPIKADAYGHGAVRVAQALEPLGLVLGFAVATVGEALALRNAGVSKTVLLLTPPAPQDLERLLGENVELVVSSEAEIEAAGRVAQRQNTRAKLHLKINTGLNRLGATPSDAPRVLQAIGRSRHVLLEGVMTHLVDSEDVGETTSKIQIEHFRDFLETHRPIARLVHAANTGAILNPELQASFDAVRPGIGLYGYAAGPDVEGVLDLTPAMAVQTRVTFVKTLQAGESLGYNATWHAPQDCRVATVRFGYADGYHRSLSNRGQMLLHGQRVPVVGRVSMDQVTLDVSHLDNVNVGDAVMVFGPGGITAEDVAVWAGTNSYEILTSLAPRVPRLYHSPEAETNPSDTLDAS